MREQEARLLDYQPEVPVYSDCPGRADLRSALDQTGIAIIENVEPGENNVLHYARWLGSPNLNIPEKLCGPPVMHLRYDSTKAGSARREAYFTSGAFPLHTDLSYVPRPPRFLLMLCAAPDPRGGGESLVADIRQAWQSLDDDDRAVLARRCFSFENAPNTGDGVCSDQPVYGQSMGRDIWRFRTDTLVYPDVAATAVENLTSALECVTTTIAMQKGSLMILDNHRFAHGRTSFAVPSPRHYLRAYADPDAGLNGEPANESVFQPT